jgi:hypothetical protein
MACGAASILKTQWLTEAGKIDTEKIVGQLAFALQIRPRITQRGNEQSETLRAATTSAAGSHLWLPCQTIVFAQQIFDIASNEVAV